MKKDSNFRIGVSSTYKKGSIRDGLGFRCRCEHADAGWVVKYCSSDKESRIEEKILSHTYNVPMMIFNCRETERLDKIFNQQDINKFYQNIDSATGAKLLAIDYSLDLNYPIWQKEKVQRPEQITLSTSLLGDSSQRGLLPFHRFIIRASDKFFNKSFVENIERRLSTVKHPIKASRSCKKTNSFIWEGSRISWNEIKAVEQGCLSIAEELGASVSHRQSVKILPGDLLEITSAKSMIIGDFVPIIKNGKIELDEIVDIKKYMSQSTYYDLEIERTHNFVTNGVFHSNSLYSFRLAKPENLNSFTKDFPNSNSITLLQNYRSHSPILKIAEKLIRNNSGSQTTTIHSHKGEGPAVNIIPYIDPEQEANAISLEIESLKKSKGYKWSDFAILYRVNSLSRSPEMALRNRSIPYKIIGGFSFFDRMEVKTVLAYLSVVANPADTINFERAISNPKRGIGEDTIGNLERLSEEKHIPIVDLCRNVDFLPKMSVKAKSSLAKFVELVDRAKESQVKGESISTIAGRLIKESGFYDHIKEVDKQEKNEKSRLENVDEMLSGIIEYERNKPNSHLLNYLRSIQLASTDIQQDDTKSDNDAVQLLTVHSAKGLEWPCVYVIGIEQNYMPHFHAKTPKDIEEERRILFVAITRSEELLNLSFCQNRFKYGRKFEVCQPSPFFEEMGYSIE